MSDLPPSGDHGAGDEHGHHHHHHGFFPGFGITVAPPVYDDGPDCYIRRRVYINQWGERVVRRVRVCN